MSLDRILEALEAEAARQIAEIEQVTQAEIEHIRRQAQVEAAAVRQQPMTASQAALRVEQTRLLNRAKQEASQVVLQAREAMISAALAAAAQQLANLLTTPAYPGLLQQLTQEAVGTLGTNQVLYLHVRNGDLELMRQFVRELGLSAEVAGDLEENFPEPARFALAEAGQGCLGGLAVTTADNRISLINTLAMRLQRVANLYRAQIAQIIFEQQREG